MNLLNISSKLRLFLLLSYLFMGFPFLFFSIEKCGGMCRTSFVDNALLERSKDMIRLNMRSTGNKRDDSLTSHNNIAINNYNKEEILDKVMIAAMDVRYRGFDECDPIELLMGLRDILDDLTDAELGLLVWSLGVVGVRMIHLEKVQIWRKLDDRIAKLDVTSEYYDYDDVDIKQQSRYSKTTSGSETNTNVNTPNYAHKSVSSITMDLFKGMNDMQINWNKFSKGSKYMLDQRICSLLEQVQISNGNSNSNGNGNGLHDRGRTFLTLVNVLGNMKVSFDELSERSQNAFLEALQETAQSPPPLFSIANTIMSLGRMKLRVDGHLSLPLRKSFRSILRTKLSTVPRSSFWKVLVGLADMGFQWTSLDVRTRMALQQELMKYDVFNSTRYSANNSSAPLKIVDIEGKAGIQTTQTSSGVSSTIKSGRYTDYVSYKEVGVMLHSLSRFNAQWSNMDAGSRQGVLAGVKGALMVMPARELSQALSCMGGIGLTWDTMLENDNKNDIGSEEEEYYISIINSKVPFMGGWDLVECILGLGRMRAPPQLIAPGSALEKFLIQRRKFIGAPLAGSLILGVGLLVAPSSSSSSSSSFSSSIESIRTEATDSMLLSQELRGVLRESVHRWVSRMSGSNLGSTAVGLALLVKSEVYTFAEVSRCDRVNSRRNIQQSIDSGGYTIRINSQSDIDVAETISKVSESNDKGDMVITSDTSHSKQSSLSSSSSLSSLENSHVFLAKPYASSTDDYNRDGGHVERGLNRVSDDLGLGFGLGDTSGYNSKDTSQQLHDLHKVVERKRVNKRAGYTSSHSYPQSQDQYQPSYSQQFSSQADDKTGPPVSQFSPTRAKNKKETEQMNVIAALTSEQTLLYMQVLADHGLRGEALLKAPVVHDALFQRIDSLLRREVFFDTNTNQHYTQFTSLLSSLVQLELLWSDLSPDIRQGITRSLCVLVPVNWSRNDDAEGIDIEEDGVVDGSGLLGTSMDGHMIAAELAWALGALRPPKEDIDVRRRGLTLVSALFTFSEDRVTDRQARERVRFLKELSSGEYARVLLALSGLGWSWREGWGTTNEDRDRRNVLRRAISLHGAQAFGWGPSFTFNTEKSRDEITDADLSGVVRKNVGDSAEMQSVNFGNIRRRRPTGNNQPNSASSSELLAVIVGLQSMGCRWTSLNRGFREAILDAIVRNLDSDSSKGEKQLILTVTTIMPFLSRLRALETIPPHIADRLLAHMAYLMDGLSIPQLVLMLPIIETINVSDLRTKEVLLKQYISIALQGHSIDMLVMGGSMDPKQRDNAGITGMNMGMNMDMDNSKYPSFGEGFTIAHLVQVTRCLLSLDGTFEFPDDIGLGPNEGSTMNMKIDEDEEAMHLQRRDFEGDAMDMDIRLQYIRHCGSLMRRFSPDELLLILQAFKLLQIRWCDFLLPVHRQTIWESVRDAAALLSPEDGGRLHDYMSTDGSGGDMSGFGLPRPLMDQLDVELRKKMKKTMLENSITKRPKGKQNQNEVGVDGATNTIDMNLSRDMTSISSDTIAAIDGNVNANLDNDLVHVNFQARDVDMNRKNSNTKEKNNNNNLNMVESSISTIPGQLTKVEVDYSSTRSIESQEEPVDQPPIHPKERQFQQQQPQQPQQPQQQKIEQEANTRMEPIIAPESREKGRVKANAKDNAKAVAKNEESESDRRLRVMSQATKKLREVLPKVQHTSFPNTLLLCAALGFDVDSMRREGLWGVVDERLAASVSSWVSNDKKLSMMYNALERLRVKGPGESLVPSKSVRPGLSTGTTLVLLRATATALDTAKPRTVSNVLYYCARMELPAKRLPSFVSAAVQAFERTAVNMDGPGEIARAIYSLAPNTGLPQVQGATKEIYRPRLVRTIGEALVAHEYDLNTKDIIMIFDSLRRLGVRYNEFNEDTRHSITRIIESFYASSMESMIKNRMNNNPDGSYSGSGISLMLYCLGYMRVPILDLNAPSRLSLLTTTVARMRKGSAREFFWGLVGLSYMLPSKNRAWQYSQLPLDLRESVDFALRRHAGSHSLRRHSIAGTFRALNSLGVKWSELSVTSQTSLCKALLRLVPHSYNSNPYTEPTSVGHEDTLDTDDGQSNYKVTGNMLNYARPLSPKAWKTLFITLQQVDNMCDGDWLIVLQSAKAISSNSNNNDDSICGISSVEALVCGISAQFEYNYLNEEGNHHQNNQRFKEKTKHASRRANNKTIKYNGKYYAQDHGLDLNSKHDLHRKIDRASLHLEL